MTATCELCGRGVTGPSTIVALVDHASNRCKPPGVERRTECGTSYVELYLPGLAPR